MMIEMDDVAADGDKRNGDQHLHDQHGVEELRVFVCGGFCTENISWCARGEQNRQASDIDRQIWGRTSIDTGIGDINRQIGHQYIRHIRRTFFTFLAAAGAKS